MITSGMNCADVTERGLIEEYLLDRMAEEGRELFEAHLFECDRCADDLKTMRALQDELARQRAEILAEPLPLRPAGYWIPATGLAAAALIGAIVWLFPAPPTRTGVSASPAAPPPAATATSPPKPHDREALMMLARVEPPRYVALTLRSADAPSAFDEAMQAYASKKFGEAAVGLRRVVNSEPNDLQANFFLAVSLLMTDDVGAAIDQLHAVLAAGDSPFRQTAEILLAKGLIQTGDLDGAERELERARRLPGSRAQEARDLLGQLRAVRAGGPGNGVRPRN